MKTSEICNDDRQRKNKIREHTDAHGRQDSNGIDFLEVSRDQTVLTVYFLLKAPENIKKWNVRIDGGRRVRNIEVAWIRPCRLEDSELDDCVKIKVDKPGDFSTYTLRLVEPDKYGRPGKDPMRGFDPRYAELDFSFKINCPTDLDCLPQKDCPPEALTEPDINYLAKDYESFRQLILDRVSLVMPEWTERLVPDIGITLVELLAYVGDYLSQYQDAVSTEAYLATARRRISVRRHARLIDYVMHEGCNARAWVFLETSLSTMLDLKKVSFITNYNNYLHLPGSRLLLREMQKLRPGNWEVFEPMIKEEVQLYEAHNTIPFYTWGETECCLPRGATTATLGDAWVNDETDDPDQTDDDCEVQPEDHHQRKHQHHEPQAQSNRRQVVAQMKQPYRPEGPKHKESARKNNDHPRARTLNLSPGDVLIFEEVIGPKTGNKADADPAHRHAVRLTRVTPRVDKLYDEPVVEIEWAAEDALPFTLCISAITDAPDCQYVSDVSVARGNIILVDHGRTLDPEDLGCVVRRETIHRCKGAGRAADEIVLPEPFKARLKFGPLTYSQPLPEDVSVSQATVSAVGADDQPARSASAGISACGLINQSARQALPRLELTGTSANAASARDGGVTAATEPEIERWFARQDLLGSLGQDKHFVVEIDNEGRANLRFGDDDLGKMPEVGTRFRATYRTGNGLSGNVGAEAISHIVLKDNDPAGVEFKPRNPLPARGGTAPESLDEVRMFAPSASRFDLQRAINMDDYARLTERNPQVQRATAVLRWTGGWYVARVAIDPAGNLEASEELLREIRDSLYRYRRIAHDIEVVQAEYVPLLIGMRVCVLPGYLRGHVKAALRDAFSDQALPGGRRGFFHPDNLTFGQSIALSQLVAAAQSVTGVESVTISKLERLNSGANDEIANGILPIGPLEIARLDNNPLLPENGRLELDMRGGR